MTSCATVGFIAACLLIGTGAVRAAVASSGPDADAAYAPLRVYNGKWRVAVKGAAPAILENHCARTGYFFACEQVLGGKPLALVVFRPESATATGWSYSTRVLLRSGDDTGAWGPLTIAGDTWIFGPGAAAGTPAARERTLNRIVDRNHIHFETQSSLDGTHWTPRSSGDEVRLR